MSEEKIDPMKNPRIPNRGRTCPNLKCRAPIPVNITHPQFYKCPKCGAPGSVPNSERGGAR